MKWSQLIELSKLMACSLLAAMLVGCTGDIDSAQNEEPAAPVETTDPSDASDSTDSSDPTESVSTTDPSDASDSSGTITDPDDYEPCGGKSCGETCTLCDPADEGCAETAVEKACDAMGECVADTGDLCEDTDYVPCAGKTCGDICTVCPPDGADCVETSEIKACDPFGECVSDTGDLCQDTYNPCDGKSCGDTCTVCAPDDLDCVETEELKACNPEGACVSDTGDLCENPYDPCAEKSCGETCTVCEPGDVDCFETGEINACTLDGRCVSDTGNLCADTSLCERINAGEEVLQALQFSGGCGDLILYATNPERTIEIKLDIAGVCEEAHATAETLTRRYDLPSRSLSLGIQVGQYVNEFTCNDAILNDPVINETLVPLSGTVELSVVPMEVTIPEFYDARVSATLSNVEFYDGDGCSFTMDYSWTDIYAGWFPGR